MAAGILGGLDEIFIKPGCKVLYLGAASGTSVSHVADIVGPTGIVYAVEFSHRSGRDLINMAAHRTNVIPIIEDARHPLRYRMLIPMVDVIFADVAQPDQARIVGHNAHQYLKVGGGMVISVKANCIDSTAAPEAVFAREVQKMKDERFKPIEQLTLEPFERGESSASLRLFKNCTDNNDTQITVLLLLNMYGPRLDGFTRIDIFHARSLCIGFKMSGTMTAVYINIHVIACSLINFDVCDAQLSWTRKGAPQLIWPKAWKQAQAAALSKHARFPS